MGKEPDACAIIDGLTVVEIDVLSEEQKTLIRSCGIGHGGGGERVELAKVEQAFAQGGFALAAQVVEKLHGTFKLYGYNRLCQLREEEAKKSGRNG